MKKNLLLLMLAVIVTLTVWGIVQHRSKLRPAISGNVVEVDGKDALRKLFYHMNEGNVFDQSGEMLLYDKKEGRKLVEQTSFRSVRNGTSYYTYLAGQFTYICKDRVIQVDTVAKLITLSASLQPNTGPMSAGLLPFDKYLQDTAAFKINVVDKEEGGLHVLRIGNELLPEIKSAAIYYDVSNYTIHKIIIEWWKYAPGSAAFDKSAIWENEIIYKTTKERTINICDEMSGIVSFKHRQIVGLGKYQDYEMVNVNTTNQD